MRFATILLAGAMTSLSFAASSAASPVPPPAQAANDRAIEQLIARELVPHLIGEDGIGGVAVAVRIGGRTLFFNYGYADMASRRPVTPDARFNLGSLRKVFEATLVAQAVQRGELTLDDPVAKYVTELAGDGAIRDVTIGQLASHTSGLLLPPDHPPWPTERYSLAQFLDVLKAWTPPPGHAPGKAHTYTHAGYVLLALALERRFDMPIGRLLETRVITPLGLTETSLPAQPLNAPQTPLAGAVQGYGEDGAPIGVPGDQQSYFDFPGTGQMYSSARDLARLASAELGEVDIAPELRDAMQVTQRPRFRFSAQVSQGLAWEVSDIGGGLSIVDKPGGINNASAYIGLVPARKIGLVILVNRGDRNPHALARSVILPALVRRTTLSH